MKLCLPVRGPIIGRISHSTPFYSVLFYSNSSVRRQQSFREGAFLYPRHTKYVKGVYIFRLFR